MSSSPFHLPTLPCLVPEPQHCKCGMIPGDFFPCSRDFPWQADSLQLLSCAPASKPKSNLKKDKILQAAGCHGFSVSVTVIWQWRGGNRNQKACNVSPRCLDKKKKENIEQLGGMHLVISKWKMKKYFWKNIFSLKFIHIRIYLLCFTF